MKLKNILFIIIYIVIALSPQITYGDTESDNYANYLDSASLKPYRLLVECQAKNDTLAMVNQLIELADIQKNQETYALSFDFLWEALLLSDDIYDEPTKALVNHELGVLFSIFYRHDESLVYFDRAIEIKQKMIDSLGFEKKILKTEYFSKAVQYNQMNMPQEAINYIDMSDSILTNNETSYEPNGYSLTQRGYSRMLLEDYVEAEELLKEASAIFERENTNYLVLTYSYLGDVYCHVKDYKNALFYYNESLEVIKRNRAHPNQKAILLKSISEVYSLMGDIRMAYKYLVLYNELIIDLYSPKGAVNSQIFSVRNKYDERIALKKELIRQQDQEIDRTKVRHMKVIFSLITIMLVGIIVGLVTWRRYQKKQDRLIVERDKANMDEMIEVKNRELTSYTLQIIDKENIITQLTASIKENQVDSSHIKHLISRDNDLWTEFDNRFTEVNSAFYSNLTAKFPDLTPTEIKHCALIKLNFSSKEMGRLLNISPESVHISRHRIRKKFGLERSDNLTKFLSEF